MTREQQRLNRSDIGAVYGVLTMWRTYLATHPDPADHDPEVLSVLRSDLDYMLKAFDRLSPQL